MNKLEIAINSAVSAGDLLMEHYGKIHETKNKEALRDIVSAIDSDAVAAGDGALHT